MGASRSETGPPSAADQGVRTDLRFTDPSEPRLYADSVRRAVANSEVRTDSTDTDWAATADPRIRIDSGWAATANRRLRIDLAFFEPTRAANWRVRTFC